MGFVAKSELGWEDKFLEKPKVQPDKGLLIRPFQNCQKIASSKIKTRFSSEIFV